MIRRSLAVAKSATEKNFPASNRGRTVVRDPRKRKNAISAVSANETFLQPQDDVNKKPMMFQPSQQNVQSLGSTLGAYMLMGAGVSMGFVFVRLILGA